MEQISNNKKQIRREILEIRENLSLEEKDNYDKIITDKFFESNYYKQANNIFIYISYGSEIDTKYIITRAIKEGKNIYVPRTEFSARLMNAVRINNFDNLIKSKYGALEPKKDEAFINPNDLDLIVVPGVAFDKNGGRIGYGAGFYDRYFKRINDENKSRIMKLVLAYDFQLMDKVPTDKEDVSIDAVITEKQFIKF
ncbi:5-formyltetrahydrofolate cyclo-ligase [Clostridium sp. SM-530-WT-3G]|uniref:5-formyltetrahydrofolate cyclo-ligase n=1 Tax=Clostridium sp. SM-530-WT-3G TaxID=2725303 RepID=UPI00145C8690|nr:5-formyltetrahydrofolate cyclo-ligase [Clostridium sp. SM-530-WT-3G]NME84205.1 5-formyltetrahydrofolate cyclo-ligase [Clostridium sp. SM-530-WT-3G]